MTVGLIAMVSSAIMPFPALARTVEVTVPSSAMPWANAANPQLRYGKGDGTRAVTVFGGLIAGLTVRFAARGTTSTATNGERIGPNGQPNFITDGTVGNSGTAFPSRYIDHASYPVHLNALVGAFIGADGEVIGKPFVIGTQGQAEVPEGAFAITMGINDDIFSDNGGELTVVVTIPEPSVTVEEEPQ